MSLANRQTFVFLVSLLAVGEAAKAHDQTTDAERVWWDRITDHLTNADGFPVKMEVTPKQLDRLRAQAKEISVKMAADYSLMVLVNVWMEWCENKIELFTDERRGFFEELHRNLDGLYALYDPNYQHIDDAAKAIRAAKELEWAVH